MNPSSQPYQPGELPPVPPAFPGDAAAASLTAEQVQALRNRNYLRADSYTRADSYGRQDSGLSFYEYQIGDGDESPCRARARTKSAGRASPRSARPTAQSNARSVARTRRAPSIRTAASSPRCG